MAWPKFETPSERSYKLSERAAGKVSKKNSKAKKPADKAKKPVAKARPSPVNRAAVDKVKERLLANGKKSKAKTNLERLKEEPGLSERFELRKREILSIWNENQDQTVDQIVERLQLGDAKNRISLKELDQLVRRIVSEAAANVRLKKGQLNLDFWQKNLQILRQKRQKIEKQNEENAKRKRKELMVQIEKTLKPEVISIFKQDPNQPVGRIVGKLQPSLFIGYPKNSLPQFVQRTLKDFIATPEGRIIDQQIKSIKRAEETLKSEIISMFKQNSNQSRAQIAKGLESNELLNVFPKTPKVLDEFIRKTLADFFKTNNWRLNLLKNVKRRDIDPDHIENALRYANIKSKVARSYQLLNDQSQFQIDLQSVGITAVELAFAAVAPASSDEERKEALSLVKASGSDAAVSLVLLENFSKNAPYSKRRVNIVDALRDLGRSAEIAKLLNEHGAIETSNYLQWSVLPPGWWNDSKYTDQITKNSKTGQLLIERLRYADQLNPLERWRSNEQLGSDPYWVFVFPRHVVAECPTHGNAIYIIKGTSDWRNLLNRPKADLLKGFPDRVVRIMHSGDWQSRLRRKLREK